MPMMLLRRRREGRRFLPASSGWLSGFRLIGTSPPYSTLDLIAPRVFFYLSPRVSTLRACSRYISATIFMSTTISPAPRRQHTRLQQHDADDACFAPIVAIQCHADDFDAYDAGDFSASLPRQWRLFLPAVRANAC